MLFRTSNKKYCREVRAVQTRVVNGISYFGHYETLDQGGQGGNSGHHQSGDAEHPNDVENNVASCHLGDLFDQ